MKPASDAVELFLCAGLDRDQIRQLAFETGFCEREPRKIQPADFLAQLCVQSAAGVVSYNDLESATAKADRRAGGLHEEAQRVE